MFDTMTMTKIVGGVCGTLLFFLFGNWAAEAIYGFGEQPPESERTYAYSIAVEGAPADAAAAGTTAAGATAAAEPTYADVSATADAAAGEKIFGKCKSCHSVEGKNMTGPHLNGVVGRNRASVDGFVYSDAMASKHDPWTPEEIFTFIKAPKEYVPGTKMGFAGLASAQDRANVVAYLATTK
ncbi:c-type cytochrome [bacterium]|nr:c-type cytochrome [bacterium]